MLVRLFDNKATLIIPIAAIITGKKLVEGDQSEHCVRARLDYKYVSISVMSKLASVRAQLQARFVNYLFTSKLL